MCTTTQEAACVSMPAVIARSCTQLVARDVVQDAFPNSTACLPPTLPPPHPPQPPHCLQDQSWGALGAAEECMMSVSLGVSSAFFPGEELLISKSPRAAKVLGHTHVTPQTLCYGSVPST